MTELTFYQEGEGKEKTLLGIEARGHSGYAERGGDVVCAAVSSLLQALLLGLCEVAKVEGLQWEMDPEGPVIRVMWPRERAEEVALLTQTVALSLREVQSGNPEHVNITEVQR